MLSPGTWYESLGNAPKKTFIPSHVDFHKSKNSEFCPPAQSVHVPYASVGIVMSCSSVTRQCIQRLGRILRQNPFKNITFLYYVYAGGASEEENCLPDEMISENNLIYDGTDMQGSRLQQDQLPCRQKICCQ